MIGRPATKQECNICGSHSFGHMNGRMNVKCEGCGSLERTRAIHLTLQKKLTLLPGARIMHLAPELALTRYLTSIAGIQYEAYDLSPNLYRHIKVKRMDLVTDCEALESNSYDLVLHSHVIEHIPCNATAVLFHLHRALKPNGVHVFCVPIFPGKYEESLDDMTGEDRTVRYKQFDHVRRFGADDMERTLGMIFNRDYNYNLNSIASDEELDRYNIPPEGRRGFTSGTVFFLRKKDMKLIA